jgi:hypothetical protein
MTLTITKGEDKIHGLAAELRRQLETKRDLVADTRRTSFAPVVRSRDTSGARYHPFVVDLPDGAEAFAVTEHAHDQIGSHLDVPAKFYDRLRHSHPELFENLMNGLLSREPSKQLRCARSCPTGTGPATTGTSSTRRSFPRSPRTAAMSR